MMKNEVKGALAIIGTVFIPLAAQADQPMYSSYGNANAYQEAPVEPSGYEPGNMVRDGQLPAGYNQTASYVCDNNWDIFVTGNYIYWAWNEGSLQIGAIVTEVTDTSVDTVSTETAIFQNPGYTSGFQTGMGFNMKGMDNWNIFMQYTWYKNTNDQDFTGTSDHPIVLNSSEFRGDDVLLQGHLEGTFSTRAQMGFQAADFLAQRAFYFGKKLTASFSTGLRAQWISQKYQRTSPSIVDSANDRSATNLEVVSRQTSWSLGPKLAFNSNWLLGYGIKMLGNVAQSALYTSYNTSKTLDLTRSNGTTVSTDSRGLHNYGTISPVTETFLGLAWGTYLCNDNFHIDLTLGYDFNIYWNYNMIYAASSQTESNMYLQGINAQLRLDF